MHSSLVLFFQIPRQIFFRVNLHTLIEYLVFITRKKVKIFFFLQSGPFVSTNFLQKLVEVFASNKSTTEET